jgi:hypothetical protein
MHDSALTSLKRLRQFARKPPSKPESSCELCNAALEAEHAHLVESASGRLLCACRPCGLLFSSQANAAYRRVPETVTLLSDFRMTDDQWENLAIPIGLAFLFESTSAGRIVGIYPSPAGPMESAPTLEAWQQLVDANPILRKFEPDTEALLAHRMETARDYYRIPIDQGYRLVGLVRSRWSGISGGPGVREALSEFFDSLAKRASRA